MKPGTWEVGMNGLCGHVFPEMPSAGAVQWVLGLPLSQLGPGDQLLPGGLHPPSLRPSRLGHESYLGKEPPTPVKDPPAAPWAAHSRAPARGACSASPKSRATHGGQPGRRRPQILRELCDQGPGPVTPQPHAHAASHTESSEQPRENGGRPRPPGPCSGGLCLGSYSAVALLKFLLIFG